jgi:hypothetical protein
VRAVSFALHASALSTRAYVSTVFGGRSADAALE